MVSQRKYRFPSKPRYVSSYLHNNVCYVHPIYYYLYIDWSVLVCFCRQTNLMVCFECVSESNKYFCWNINDAIIAPLLIIILWQWNIMCESFAASRPQTFKYVEYCAFKNVIHFQRYKLGYKRYVLYQRYWFSQKCVYIVIIYEIAHRMGVGGL